MQLKSLQSFRFIILILFSLVIQSCQKDIEAPDLPLPNSIEIQGVVTDELGRPLQNVSIKAGNSQTLTDANGAFRIAKAMFTTNEKFVTASIQGYFTGSRTFFTRENSNHYLRIQLLPRTEVASLNSSIGGVANISGASVSFPANAFALTDGTAYSGIVSVKGTYIDPTSSDMNEEMPGDLRGIRTGGELRGLKSFGMINVELEGSSGQKLKLRSGISAEINMPVPPALASTAGENVPLWYFDESIGLWKEEGIAQKTGNRYIGSVTHFTFWNVDEPFQYVDINMRVINTAQQGISVARVELTSLVDSSTSYDYTDNNGYIDGYVPINAQLKREIYNECDALVYSDIIGPFSTDASLGNVQVTSAINLQTISGTVTDCNNLPLTNGYVIISLTGQSVYADISNGAFTTTFSNCSASTTATLIAVNESINQQSSPVTINLTTQITLAGIIQACGTSSQEFISITVDGDTRTWNNSVYDMYAVEDTTPSSGFHSLYLGAYDTLTTGSIDLVLFRSEDSTVAPFNIGIESLSIWDQLATQNMLGDYYLHEITQPARLTEYGNIGQFFTGSFSGLFIQNTLQSTDTANVSVSFRLRRDPF